MILTGNAILITGGSSGIGLSLARQFASKGNTVIITGRNADKLTAIQKAHPDLITFAGDLTDTSSLRELVKFIEHHHPTLNILINNAAVQYNYHFADEPDIESKIACEIATNLTAPIQLTGLLLPRLLEQKNSAIVNVSSGLWIAPKKSASVYCATKSAIHAYTKTLRYQLENTPVRVFEIIPSLVDTPMTAGRGKSKISPDELTEEFLRNFQNDKTEIYIGKTKLLRFIHRLSPAKADRIMKNGL